MNRLLDPVTRFFATVTGNPISLAGSALTTITAFLFLLLFSIHLVSAHGASPYLGILTFLILPGLFVLGLGSHPPRPVAGTEAPPAGPRRRRSRRRVRRARLQPPAGPQDRPRLPRRDRHQRPHPRGGHLQGRRGHGVDPVLRRRLPQGDGARVHDLPALPPRAGQVRGVPHRRGSGLVRQVEALGLVAARLRGPQPLPASDRGPRPQPAPRPRDLRAVPLAQQVRGRPVQGQHALRGGRGEHRDEDRPRGEGRRPAGGPQPGHPLARGPRPRRCATGPTRSARRSTRSRRRRRTARSSASSGPPRRRPRRLVPPSGGRWTASTATTGRPTSTATPTASSTPPSSTGGSTPPCRSSAARA